MSLAARVMGWGFLDRRDRIRFVGFGSIPVDRQDVLENTTLVDLKTHLSIN
jgi:hypothetical protein